MPIQPFRKVRTQDPVIRQLQDSVELPLKDISNRAVLDGQIIFGIDLIAGTDNSIQHKLQRALTGWIVIQQSANSSIWDDQLNNTRPQDSLILRCSADVTVNLWVF